MRRPLCTPLEILCAAITVAIVLLAIPSARAGSEAQGGGAILSNLPAHDSAGYKALLMAAGQPDSEALDMTKSEMWNVTPDHLEALIAAGATYGVTVTKLDNSWNRALAPMAADVLMTQTQKDMMHATMESKAVMGVSMMALPQANVLEYALTNGMHAQEKGAMHAQEKDAMHAQEEGAMHDQRKSSIQPSLVIPLDDKITVTAQRLSIEKEAANYIWRGVVTETGEPVTLLWWPNGRLSGSITFKGHVYAVKNMGGDMHGVVDMMPGGLPPEHAPMAPDTMKKMNMNDDPLVRHGDASMMPDPNATPPAPRTSDRVRSKNLEDAPLVKEAFLARAPMFTLVKRRAPAQMLKPAVISVLVAYTKQAASHYSDIEKDLIALTIADANQSFRNSGIGNVRLELVHSYQTDYVEDGSHFEHVFRFADKDDGYMDDVHALRDRYRADVAVLIVHDPHGCGLAAQVQAPENRAFAVVHHECAATTYSLGHEIGHLIGARHDEALDDSKTPFPYGHGFVSGKQWRTMMSYKESCDGCPRLPLWSNPDVKVRGVPAGSKTSNNARVVAEQAARVAGFR